MELYNFLESATDGATLQVRVDALCKGRVFGESLTLSMLHTIMEALQNAKDGDFTRDIGLISEEVRRLACGQQAKTNLWNPPAPFEDEATFARQNAYRDRFSSSTSTSGEPRCTIEIYLDGRVRGWRRHRLDMGTVQCRSVAREL